MALNIILLIGIGIVIFLIGCLGGYAVGVAKGIDFVKTLLGDVIHGTKKDD